MLCVYTPDCTDFSGNGLGTISPSSALVKETLNGEYELEIVHPLDDTGKWHRLVEGYIVRAPVPASATPQVALAYKAMSESKAIYKVNTKRNPLVLRSSLEAKYKKLGKYKKGKEVIVLEKTTDALWEVVCPDGKRGYMPAASLAFVRNASQYADATGEVIEPRQLRDQPFRIYRVVPELDKVTAYARHIFYDLLENMVKTLTALDTTTGKTVVDQLSAACLSEHDFTFYSDLSTTAEEVSYENKNPVDILLGDGGIVEKYGGELQRDWFDVFMVARVGSDTNIQIRQGKNLTGIKYDLDMSDVVTRIMPTGQDKDGKVLYLPEVYVDSPNIANYPAPKWIHLAVSDCKEVTKGKTKKSKEKCYTQMREAAQSEFDKGCDQPAVTLTVEFIDVTQTEEYRQYSFLQSIFLGDAVRVIAKRVGVEVSMRMTAYTYNCLTRQYEKMTLTEQEIDAGQTDSGRIILETSITASDINTTNLLGTFALINDIDAARIDVDQLFARQAFIDKLNTSIIQSQDFIELVVGTVDDTVEDAIAKKLTDMGIPTPRHGTKWWQGTVRSILTNEKYKGDALMQKYYTEDFLTKKQVANNGVLPQYYVEGNHEAIIAPETFELVQREIARRREKKGRYSGVDIFSSRIVCGECGAYYGSKVWHSKEVKYRRVIFRCNRKYDGDRQCATPHVTEEQMKQLFTVALNKLVACRDEIITAMTEDADALYDTSALEAEESGLLVEMNVLSEKVQAAISENARVALDQKEYQKKFDELDAQATAVKEKHDEIAVAISVMMSKKIAAQKFITTLRKLDGPVAEFSPELWGTLLDHATVYASDDIRFTFRNGAEIKA